MTADGRESRHPRPLAGRNLPFVLAAVVSCCASDDYVKMNSDDFEHLFRVTKQRADAGDAAAMNVLGSLYVDMARQSKNRALLEEAEDAFRKAAELGNESAERFVNGIWPSIKQEYVREISEQPDLGGDV